MPTVRRAERQVSTNQLRGGQMQAAESAASQGAGVDQARAESSLASATFGERVTRFGAEMFGRIQQEERDAADQTALMAANNKLATWKNQRLYDPQSGAFTQKGEAALPLPEQLHGEFEKVAGEIEASLGTPKQKAAFQSLRSQEWQGIDLQVRRHVFGEMQAYQAGELKSLVDNSINAAIQNALDPRMVNIELTKAVSAIQTSGKTLGLGPEMVEAQVLAAQTATHVGVISSLLAQEKDAAASTYFQATKDQIAGDKQDQIIKALEEGGNRAESQKLADKIIADGGTLTAQRAEARKIADPKLRDLVEQRLEHNDAVEEREERERTEADMRVGYDILDQNPDVTKIPPSVWMSYSGATRSAMMGYAMARVKGVPVETDLGTYYSRMREAGDAPEAFVKRNLLEDRARLGEAEFKQLAGLQLSIKNSDTKATEKELAPFRTKQELLDTTLTLHGIDPKAKYDSREGKAIAQLTRMLDRRVELLQAGGKKATNEDIQSEIDRILMNQTKGSWWNIFPGGQPFYDKRLIDTTIDDIPPAERKKIEGALGARGHAVTDATVLDLYLETQIRSKK